MGNLKELDTPRTEEEFDLMSRVGDNTNKSLVLYFQSIINQGVELPIFVNSKNQVMDGHHRIQSHIIYLVENKYQYIVIN